MSISQIPSGWTITRSDERIVVQHVSGSFYAAAPEGDSGIAESILYMLADSLLSATLSPAHIEDGEEVEVVERYRAVLGGLKGLAWERLQEFSLRPSVHAEVVELMTVAQHQRMTAALVARNEWLEQVAVEAAETEKHALQIADAYRSGLTPPAEQVQDYFPGELLVSSVMNSDEVDPTKVAALSAPPAAGVPDAAAWETRCTTERRFSINQCSAEERASHWREQGRAGVEVRALVYAAPTPPASEQQQTVLRHKFEGLVEEVRLKDAEIARLAEQVMNLQAYRDGESGDGVWHWQGDGEDHLESLICPIVIRAQDLRRLVASEQQRAVVMPERRFSNDQGPKSMAFASGFNACLNEFLRLNPHLAKGEGV